MKKKNEVDGVENRRCIQINTKSERNNQILLKSKGAKLLTEKRARKQLA